MKKKLLTILLSTFMMLGTFVNVVYAQSFNITISCNPDQGYFTYDSATVPNPSTIQVEKDSLVYYREGTDGTWSAQRLWIWDSYPFGNMLFFAVAEPNEGYDFDGWYVGDTKIGTGTTAAGVNDNVIAKFVSYTKKASGTVLDDEGNPVEGAEVKFNSNDLYKFYTTTTGPDGKWSVDAKKNGTYSLTIKKSGYAIFKEDDIDFGETDKDLGSRQLTKLQLTYSTNGNGNTLTYSKTDDTITLTANPASGYQLNYYDITLDPEDWYYTSSNVQYNGKSLKFTMPDNFDIDVVGNFAQYIDNVAISVELPENGDTEFACPTVTNDKLYIDPDDVSIYDMDEALDNYNWDTPTEFVEGGHYMVEFGVYVKDDYLADYMFKYNGDNDDFDSFYYYGRDYYSFDVDLTLNETTIPIFLDDDEYNEAYETIGESGFYGCDYSYYKYLWVVYQFTVSGNKPAFNNQEFNIKDNYTGTLEFVVDKSYNTDDGSDVTVKVDNVVVDRSNYDLAKASTHVTLHNDFLRSLSIGEHNFTISIIGYEDATQKFTISSSTPSPTPTPDSTPKYIIPNTGVEGKYSNNNSLLKISSLSLLAIGTYLVIKKKKDN
ncbi:MAG: carboxypeptidase-like regulatory domain-containing protein [Erysipelotrichaceae bacterium]|nr:carboxypeptidase-like regulatory domain-containing protein [Erysipelotrichaceae bacterium]